MGAGETVGGAGARSPAITAMTALIEIEMIAAVTNRPAKGNDLSNPSAVNRKLISNGSGGEHEDPNNPENDRKGTSKE
jgi:hypothetical protein